MRASHGEVPADLRVLLTAAGLVRAAAGRVRGALRVPLGPRHAGGPTTRPAAGQVGVTGLVGLDGTLAPKALLATMVNV